MNSLLFLLGFGLLCTVAVHAERRTFTNKEGKSIEADLVAVSDGKAVLRLPSGRTAKVPLESLSDQNQSFIKSWWEENKNKITAEYTIYKRTSTRNEGGSDLRTEEIRGSADPGTLKPHDKLTFTTDPVQCEDNSSKTSGGNRGSKSTRKNESIQGIVVRLSVGGEEFLKQSQGRRRITQGIPPKVRLD